MTSATFDLTSEGWIVVRSARGELTTTSLADALARASSITGLAGDGPTQDAAIIRLLSSAVRRIYREMRSSEDWSSLWDRGDFDEDRVGEYFDQHRARFDLLHPETPFYQVAGLSTAKGELTELARLVPDVPAGHPYFTVRSRRDLTTMSFAEAARWVVHCQAFDPSGIKSGALGDDRVKGGKGYPIGVAWCGWLGLVIPEGATLFETLMLNLQLPDSLPDPDVDLPVWERPPQGPTIESGHAAPRGPVDLLTWQSRRIRLGHDGTQVTGVLIANGDPLHPRDQFRSEYMTNWRNSDAQKRALKSPVDVFMPRAHQPGRAIWRGLESLVAYTDEGAHAVTGQWLEWLAQLQVERHLPKNHPVRVRTVGVEYGAQSSVIADLVDDRLNLSLSVLTDPIVKKLAVDAVRDVDRAAQAVGRLAFDYALADGASDQLADVARGAAREQLYTRLDPHYRRWVAALSTDSEDDLVKRAWQGVVRHEAQAVGRELTDATSRGAWMSFDDGARPSAARAQRWFFINLKRQLHHAYPDQEGEGA